MAFQDKELLRLTTAGSVDDGKSTLIGRLLHDAHQVYDDQLAAIQTTSQRKGLAETDLALLLDGLSSEREQGITIDVAYRYFSTPKRRIVIADVPGHEQYTRNMVTGASTANLAVNLVNATKGLLIQAKRHLFISSLLEIPHVLVAVNKMDLVGYRQTAFEKIKMEVSDFASRLHIRDLQFIPISALKGDMIVERGTRMDWYDGYTFMRYLENLHISSDRNLVDFRFPIQMVIRPNADFRGYAGRIEGGVIKKGDDVAILPSRKKTKIKSIVTYDGELSYAFEPQSVVIQLEDDVDAGRGDMIIRQKNLPEVASEVEAMICRLSEDPLRENKIYIIKQTTHLTRAFVSTLRHKINMDDLHRQTADQLALNEIGRVSVKAHEPLKFDPYAKNRNTGSFILIDELTCDTVGAGIILDRSSKMDFLEDG